MGCKALLLQGDVGNYDDACRMAQEIARGFEHLDILINNAGVTSDRSFSKMDQAAWRKVMTTNLDGVFNCTKVFIDGMIAQGWGRVVNVTSVIGQIGNFGQVNYASSKAGVAAFTKSLAKEVAAKGITVNAIAPGFIETEMLGTVPEQIRAKLLEQIPMRRFGRAEEVARACVYLCSPDGDYITGTELSINGGLYMFRLARRHPFSPQRSLSFPNRCSTVLPRWGCVPATVGTSILSAARRGQKNPREIAGGGVWLIPWPRHTT
jgi:NAD(P)-dependent dehydrogenase (short-subunit alcohol dehydrogenase family)